jgi:hypothetical protein
MADVLEGVLITCASLVGLFFLRFWRQTRDLFFLLLASAFWVLALNWIGLAVTEGSDESRTYFYFLRLVAYLLILIGIWHKNRAKQPSARSRGEDPSS